MVGLDQPPLSPARDQTDKVVDEKTWCGNLETQIWKFKFSAADFYEANIENLCQPRDRKVDGDPLA